MSGDIELDPDKLVNVMNVSLLIRDVYTGVNSIPFQLWLDNQSGMASLTSVFKRLNLAVSGLYSAFFGQTLAQSRLNVVASYDQSNELFKVGLRFLMPGIFPAARSWLMTHVRLS
jgi:hypothetical protein